MFGSPGQSLQTLVVDARVIRSRAAGVGHFTAGLLQGLDAIAEEMGWRVAALRLSESVAEHSPWSRGVFDGLRNIRVEDITADYEDHPKGDLWLQFGINDVMRRLKGDVLVSPAFICPWGPRPFKRVLVVHDTIAWDVPGNYPKRFEWYLRTWVPQSAESAERVVSVSPPSAKRVRALVCQPRIMRDRKRVGVVPNATDSALFHPAKPEEKERLPDGSDRDRPVIVYVASLEPRKNHRLLIEAMRRHPLVERDAQLVLVGGGSQSEEDLLAQHAGGLRVRFIKPQTSYDVAAWIRAADVAVQPSTFEGFGLPALEAMACGTPLVASRIPTLEWLTKDGACARLCDPNVVDEWTEAIATTLDGGPHVEARRQAALKRAEKFDWRKSARRLIEEANAAMGAETIHY
ncbi:MAG: glycosyltransferase family 1 protein [Sumerlaeia bacterium]